MLKYVNHDIVFQEFPDEVTLAVNLSRCPCACPGCHSTYLWGDNGEELTEERIPICTPAGIAAVQHCPMDSMPSTPPLTSNSAHGAKPAAH